MFRVGRLTQEQIVFALAVALFIGFSLFLPRFLSSENILTLVRNVSVLGILGVAMALAVIGRGIDLSLVALMAMSVAWTFHLMEGSVAIPVAPVSWALLKLPELAPDSRPDSTMLKLVRVK